MEDIHEYSGFGGAYDEDAEGESVSFDESFFYGQTKPNETTDNAVRPSGKG